MLRQRRASADANFVDELDEPSTRLAGIDLARGRSDVAVFLRGRAAGPPVSPARGPSRVHGDLRQRRAHLRFSSASNTDIARILATSFTRCAASTFRPTACSRCVRRLMTPGTSSRRAIRRVRIRCCSRCRAIANEPGGDLPQELRTRIEAGDATIPALTELVPPSVAALLEPPASIRRACRRSRCRCMHRLPVAGHRPAAACAACSAGCAAGCGSVAHRSDLSRTAAADRP